MTSPANPYPDPLSIPAEVNGKPKPPPEGSATVAQAWNTPFPAAPLGDRFLLGPSSFLLGPGGTVFNPLNFVGWQKGGYFGWTWVYDWMLRHPRIQQARSIVVSPIIQSTWSFDCDSGCEDQKAAIESNWNRLRADFILDALRALDYGCSKFEPCWKLDDNGTWIIEQMKPLADDRAGVWADHGGNFTGLSVALRPDLDDETKKYLDYPAGPNLPAAIGKAFIYTFDKKNGYLHGRAVLENIREAAWIPWLTTAQQLILMGGKISGRQAYATVPPGSYNTSSGPRTYAQDASDALKAFLEGKNPIFTSLVLEALDKQGAVDPELKVKLLTESLVKFNVVDFGNLGPAIDAKLKELDKYEDLMFAGYHLSARTGMESQHGSRADSEQHTETGSSVSQIIGNSVAAQVQKLIDFQCRLNWNLKPGQVRIAQAPLRDTEAEESAKFVEMMAQANPDVAATIAEMVDWKKKFAAARIPILDGTDFATLLKEKLAATQSEKAPADPATKELSTMLSRMLAA